MNEKIQLATQMAISKLNGLYYLNYFDNTNLDKNKQTLKKSIITEEKVLSDGQFAAYIVPRNEIIIEESNIDFIPLEQLALLLLHEFLHLASSNVKEGKNGYENPALPLMYNEGCTQWLALKLMYGKDLEQAIEKNVIYPETVKLVDKLIKKVGEEKVFLGYFKNDIKMSTSSMDANEHSLWLDTVMEMMSSKEEIVSNERMKELEQRSLNQTSGVKK